MGSLLPGWDNDALDAKPGARVRQGEAPPEPARDGAPALRAAEELRREKERLERLERLAAAAPHSASRAPPYSPETTASLLRDMDLAAWGRALGEARRSAGLGRAAFDHDSCSAVDHAAVASVAAAANLPPPTRRSDRAETLNPAAAERLRARLERLSRDHHPDAPAADEDAEISAETPAAGPRLELRRRLVVRARLLVVDARAPAEESVVRVVLTVVRGDDAFAKAEVDREALVGVVNEAFRRRERALACGDDDDSVDAPRRRFFSDDDDDDAEKSPQRGASSSRTSWWGRTESAHLNRPTDETGTPLGGARVLGRSGSEVGAGRRRASARLSDGGPEGAREGAEDGGAARGGRRGGPATPTRGREGRRGGRGASFVPQFMKSWESESEGGAG